MHIRKSVNRTSRNLNLALHLTVEITLSIIASARTDWRKAAVGRRLVAVCRNLLRSVRYYVSWAFDPHDYFAVDGDGAGRRRSRLNRGAQRQRRQLADLRRRRIGMLLQALGDTPQQVQASLTRQWLIGGADHPFDLIEDYLQARLRHRDPYARNGLMFWWVCEFGGTWVSLPAPVRRYLAQARDHLHMLETHTRLPRRGPRILTCAIGQQAAASRTCRCCAPVAP